MSKITELPQVEKHLTEQFQAFETLKGDESFNKEIEFESKLRQLLSKYGYSLKDAVNLLAAQEEHSTPTKEFRVGSRRPRQAKF